MRLSRLNAWLASSLIFLTERALPARAEEPARPSEAEIGSIQQYLTPHQAVREIWNGVASVDTLVAKLKGRVAVFDRGRDPGAVFEVVLPGKADP